ncbi:hypothetical protein AC578_1120 [Pseudocercospora eumusae]|uniref:Uncharacterized protein n=1 Tax=Pseudocercospora eumusae TaxID=321146 RepID=A0A139GXH2_9PEZI|nr:hypothetical protein AC578_1120 [Pseudocercospora eumusae]
MTDHDHPLPHNSSTRSQSAYRARSRSASSVRSQSTPPRPDRGSVSAAFSSDIPSARTRTTSYYSVSVFGRRGSQSSEVDNDGSSDAGLKNNPNDQSLGGRNVDRSRQAPQRRHPSWEVLPSVSQLRRCWSPQKAKSSKPHDDPAHRINFDWTLNRDGVDKEEPGARRRSSSTSTSQHFRQRKLRNIFSADILCIAIIILSHVLACLVSGMFFQQIGRTTTGGQNRSGGQDHLHIHQQPQTPPPFYGSGWPNSSSSSSSQRKPSLSSVAVVFPLQEFRNTKWEYLAFTEEIEEIPHPFSHSGLSNLATICPFPWTTKKDKTEESKIWIWMNIDGGGGDKFRSSAIEVLKEIFVLAQQYGQQECQWEVMRILEFFERLELGFD